MRKAAPVVLVLFALGVAFVVGRNGRSRESALPLSRAVADHEKVLDRGAAIAFPLSADEERRIGEVLDRSLLPPPAPPGMSEGARAALWRELGLTAAASPIVVRFRGRYEFRATPQGGDNAFALPGGFVYVTAPLLSKLAADPDALLYVAGHEIGHIELGHTADAYRLTSGGDPARVLLGGAVSIGRLFAALHFSESQELEADAYSVRLLASLRRDPGAALRAFDALGLTAEKEIKRGPGEVALEGLSDYFHTHPGAWERRAALEREIGRVR